MKCQPAELAQTLFEEAGDALFLFDPDSEEVLDVNPMSQRLCGYTRQELLKFPITYLFRSEAPQGLQRLRHAFKKTGVFHSQEGFLLRQKPGGAWMPVNLTISRLHAEPKTLGLLTARDVREQRAVQEDLKQSEARLATILATATDGIMLIDCSGRITFANQAAERILGVPRGQLVGSNRRTASWQACRLDGRLIGDEDFTFLQVLRIGEPVADVERLIRRRDGTEVIITLSAAPVRDAQGGIAGIVVSLVNVTAQRRAEQAVRESEAKYRNLVETSHDLIWSVDAEGRFTFVNQQGAVNVLGREASDVIGRHYHEVVDPAYAQKSDDAFRQTRDQGVLFNIEGAVLRPDGRRVYTSSNCLVVRDEEGNFLGNTGTALDITARKETEEVIRRNEQRLRAIIETTPDCVKLVAADGTVLEMNPAGLQMIEAESAEQALGACAYDLISPSDRDRYRAFNESVCAGERRRLQYEITTLKGKRRWLESQGVPLFNPSDGTVVQLGIAQDITERRLAEQALSASERRYRLLVERNLAGVFRTARDGRILECNDALAHIFGFESKEEMQRHNAASVYFQADDRRELLELLQQQGSVQNHEARRRRKDGNAVWILESISQTQDEKGDTVYDGTIIDITERKQAEEALLERAMLFSLRAEVSVALSQGGDLQPVLQRCAEVLYRQLDVAFFRIWTLNEADQVLELQASAGLYTHRNGPHSRVPVGSLKVGRIAATCLPYVTNSIAADPDISDAAWARREGMIAFAGYPLLVEDRCVGVMATFAKKQLTASSIAGLDSIGDLIAQWIDRKRAEEALRASEAKYRALLENLEQCVFLKDRELRFVAVNRPFCATLGRPVEEIVGKSDLDFYPPDLANKYRADDLRIIQYGHRFEGEEENLAAGQRRVVRVIKTPVRNGHGRVEGVLGIFWDVTEQRALEAQLRQAQKMEGIGQLAGGIAHDFNNLLQAVLGNTSLALAGMPASDPNRSLIVDAEKATLRASDLVRKLLGFSRKTMLQLEALQLNTAVAETLEFFRRSIDPRIQVDFQPAPELGLVQADPSQMGQVILNLCINARDAMPDGGRVSVTTANVLVSEEQARWHVGARPGRHVRLRVSDTGHGMTPEVQARIFEPFFTTKEAGKGTGLGLAMVFGIVQQHQGWIECQSEVGRGTTFTICLPRFDRPTPTAAVQGQSTPSHGHETILFVEDEPVVRMVGRTILERFGYNVLLAEDGRHALDIYQREGPGIALVILDLTMPRLSGRETLGELIKVDPQVRVIFSSGYSAEPPMPADDRNVFGFIGKPYRPDELASTVRGVLDRVPAKLGVEVNS